MVALEPVKTFAIPSGFAKIWLDALENGGYDQVDGYLMKQDYENFPETDETDYNSPIPETKGYCCLGVAGAALGISDTIIEDGEVPADAEDAYREAGMPDIFMFSCQEAGKETAVGVMTRLNDGIDINTYKALLKQFPHLVFPKIPPDEWRQSATGRYRVKINYTFQEIAHFIRLNFKTYDDE